MKYLRSRDNTIWVDVGDFHPRSSLGTLRNYLVGNWKEHPNSFPLAKEVESWAKAVWRLKGGSWWRFIKTICCFLSLTMRKEANFVLEGGWRTFKGGVLNIDRWNPNSGCVKRKNQVNVAWVKVVGLPLQLWTHDILRMIEDGCGGFLAIDKETTLKTKMLWARILGKLKGKESLSIVNILADARSYKLQLWREMPPWVAKVYPSKRVVDFEVQNKEEDECTKRIAQGVCNGRKFRFDEDLTSRGDMEEGQ